MEDISHVQIVSLVYKLTTSAKDTDDLSIGFEKNRGKRKNELALNKNIKGKYHLKVVLKDVIGFAEHQEKATYGLGFKLTLTRNEDDAVKDKVVVIANARIKIDHIHWYVPHYTPSIQQQNILSNQILSKTPTELRYIERSVFMKEEKNQNHWSFELGSQENVNIAVWVFIGFQQRDRQNSHDLNNDIFYSLPVTSA